MTLETLFDEAARRRASDIHLASGEPPRLRIDGVLVPLEGVPDLPRLLEPLLTPEALARLGAGMPVERTLEHGDLAFVVIVFRIGERGLAATFRILPKGVPSLDAIAEDALPLFRRIMDAPRGLILIVGRTGSGKWTTACALVDAINAEKAARIFVVEGHPALRFENKRSLVTQFHVGQDREGHARALAIARQADVDVVALDDVPTDEALRQALALVDTGCLVVANLNAETAAQAVEGLLESAGDEAPALRRALAESLLAVTAQRLLPGLEGRGRVPLYEWIVNTPTMKQALLDGDLAQAQAEDPECRTRDAALEALVAAGKVARG